MKKLLLSIVVLVCAIGIIYPSDKTIVQTVSGNPCDEFLFSEEPCTFRICMFDRDGNLVSVLNHAGNEADCKGIADGMVKRYQEAYPNYSFQLTMGWP